MATTCVSVRTVTVNAAFLQELKEVNQDLWNSLKEIREACQQPIELAALGGTFVEQLENLRDELALHFALEEAYGYFDDPVYVAPQLCEKAMALRDEHRQLYLEVCDLVEWSFILTERRVALSRVEDLISAFLAFDDQLRRHESRENALILQEYDDDLGVGD